MFLSYLRLKNIRCFSDVEIDFDVFSADQTDERNRKWTVLLGENGTGKSTVLKSAALLAAGSDALVDLMGDSDDWLRLGADRGSIEGVIETAGHERRELRIELERGESISRFIARSQETLDRLNAALDHTTRSYPVFAYGASRRLGGTVSAARNRDKLRSPRARSMASLFFRDAELHPLEKWAVDLDYRTDGTEIGIVRDVLSDFLPDLQFAKIDKSTGRLLFDTADGLVPLEQLSDGYQNVAAWVGDLLYQISDTFDDYKDPLSARGLLIIDEVDLHLHPKWQRTLIDFLEKRLPNMQILCTTHSVVTAQQTPEHSLYYCIRSGDEPASIERFAGNPGSLLLNQLIVTEAFGQIPDESLDVEAAKDRYRALSRKSDKDHGDQLEMRQLEARIGAVPDDPQEDIRLTAEQRELMQSVLKRRLGADQ